MGTVMAVLALLRRGDTAQAIAHELSMSPRTVHSHLANSYRKLGVNDRMRAVLVADELGLLRQPGQLIIPAGTVRTHVSWPTAKATTWILEDDADRDQAARGGTVGGRG